MDKELITKNLKRIQELLDLADSTIPNSSQSNMSACNIARNRIFFGAPGTGKSYSLKVEAESLVCNNDDQMERVTFHPDYTYANFVGSYKPVMKQSNIECLDDDSKKVLSVLNNSTITTQEKYDVLYESFKSTDGLTRLPIY